MGGVVATIEAAEGEAPEEPAPQQSEAKPTPAEATGEEPGSAADEARAEADQATSGPQRAKMAPQAAGEAPATRSERGQDEPQAAGAPVTRQDVETSPGVNVPASPSVRRFAREIGVDVAQVKGTGPYGRISVEDVKAFSKQSRAGGPAAAGAPAGVGTIAAPPLPDFAKWGEVEAQELSNIRGVIARRLAYAWAAIPHVHHQDKADVTELEALRKRRNEKAGEQGARLTMTAVILKVLARVLKQYPSMNSSLDLAANRLILKNYIHIGVAVDTERGLLVPVVRDVDQKSIIQIAGELDELSKKARAGKLTPDEMKGGTFTVSNLGGIGGTQFNPIVNWPEVGILGVSRASLEYVMHEGSPAWRLMMPVCLGYDHRVVDGADAARFTRDVVAALSSPFNLLLEL